MPTSYLPVKPIPFSNFVERLKKFGIVEDKPADEDKLPDCDCSRLFDGKNYLWFFVDDAVICGFERFAGNYLTHIIDSIEKHSMFGLLMNMILSFMDFKLRQNAMRRLRNRWKRSKNKKVE